MIIVRKRSWTELNQRKDILSEIKTAIILAAGRGKRLKTLSDNQPKPMIRVNGISIIQNLVEGLIANGIDTIVVVVGYRADLLKNHLKKYSDRIKLIFITNDIWNSTNNIYSLWLAQDYLRAGFFLFEADVICDPAILRQLIEHPRENVMLIDKFSPDMNGTVVECDSDDCITGVFLKRDQDKNFDFSNKYKTVNFYKIGKDFYQSYFKTKLATYIRNAEVNYYYELIIKNGVDDNREFWGLKTGALKWYEIDTPDDLEKAVARFRVSR